MKITLLHGDNEVASRDRLVKIISTLKQREWEIVRSVPEPTSSLFRSKLLFVVEDVSKLSKFKFESDFNLLVWHKGFISAKYKKIFPKGTKIEEYKIPVLIWKFLDSLYPGNSKESLKLLHLIKSPTEFVFSLLCGHIRDLYWVKVDPDSLDYPSWRKSRLLSRTSKYTKQQLKRLIKSLAGIDMKVKTSSTNLLSQLDLAISKELG